MTKHTLPELLGDLDDLISRFSDAGLPVAPLEKARRHYPVIRHSLLAANTPKRTEAEHIFRNVSASMRRLRGDQ